MHMLRDEFIHSPAGLVARYRANLKRGVDIRIEGIEPGSKRSMASSEKAHVQMEVLRTMEELRRRSFRGRIALRLQFETSNKTPPHLQTITKNFLDLLGRKTHSHTKSRMSRALYSDDSQIDFLSASCRHGEASPTIRLTALPHGAFAQNLAIATYLTESLHRDSDDQRLQNWEESADKLGEFREDENYFRQRFGDDVFGALVKSYQRDAQEALFKNSRSRLWELAHMSGAFRQAFWLPPAEGSLSRSVKIGRAHV